MASKFTIYKDKAGQFRFNLKAANGEIIAVGESYPDKKSVLKGIASIQKNAPIAQIVDDTAGKEAPKKAAAKPAPKKAAPKKPAAKKEAPKPEPTCCQ